MLVFLGLKLFKLRFHHFVFVQQLLVFELQFLEILYSRIVFFFHYFFALFQLAQFVLQFLNFFVLRSDR